MAIVPGDLPQTTFTAEPHGERLLVVDDNQDNLDMLARRLKRRGYEITTAQSGPEALAAVARLRYDAIVLDINMPAMSGLDVLRELRRHYSKLELPVLMATARSESDDMVEALSLGANDYVTKPLNFAEVVARLATHLALRREFTAMRGEVASKVRSTDAMVTGTVVDRRYEIECQIGHGGFAVVYRARQLSTGQAVALKVLRARRAMRAGADGIEYTRFRREMQVIGAVKHPAIVRLIDSGSLELEGGWSSFDDETPDGSTQTNAVTEDSSSDHVAPAMLPPTARVPFFVMECLEGETLAQLLERDQKLSLEDTLELFFPIIGGVHALHRRGIVHRDIKPSNVFLHDGDQRRPQPKVLDFGIAKLKSEEAEEQMTVGFVGTPSYMSPEQALGERDIDARCDQYALGVMLYECLCGQRPFTADNYTQVLLLVTAGEFTSLAKLSAEHEQVSGIIEKAMHRERAHRYADLQDFGRALLEVAPESVRARWRGSLDE
ncbi:Phosphate regulon transcriptional regulatory protein PhoB (SphR) [Enhygromyxa salina]|uniref:Phosphate regulon transcriptional regulatory protein PhoB (SphR) n=1 Tax=Enhygromyxa salina TaxID=215803 RepID=A0A0C2CXL5_9BACT|nr:Phosphate regulon transcriptional regulatory protein PhoB (SphR) [Enhygromyxa salina]